MPSGELASPATDASTLTARLRAALGVTLVGTALFALADLWVAPDARDRLLGLKAGQSFVYLALLVALRRPRSDRFLVATGIGLVGMTTFASAQAGIWTADAITTPVLMVITSMATATLLPWGIGPQLASQALSAAALLYNAAGVGSVDDRQRYLSVAVFVGFVASLYAAWALDRNRREREQVVQAHLAAVAARHRASLAHAARLSTLGGMAAGIAHEVNQPLTAIVGYARGAAHRLRAGRMAASEAAEVVDEIARLALRSGAVLERVRAFARRRELARGPVDLRQVVGECAELLRFEHAARHDRLEVELPSAPVPVAVDAIQVQQVLLNLLHNGFESQAEGDTRVRLTLACDAGDAVLRVTDTGAGLDPALADRIFDPFFTAKPEGLGLGLSIGRSIAEAHGGTLAHVPSDAGACFELRLPLLGGEPR